MRKKEDQQKIVIRVQAGAGNNENTSIRQAQTRLVDSHHYKNGWTTAATQDNEQRGV